MEKTNCNNCDSIKELRETIEKINKRVADLESDRKLQTYQNEQIIKKLEELTTDIKELKDKPNKRYDSVATTVITTVVASVVAFIVGKLF